MKIIDVLWMSLIVIGVLMTVVAFFTASGPSATVRDIEIHEIAPPPPPATRIYGQPI